MLGEPEYRSLRVMIAGGKAQPARVLRTALNLVGIMHIVIVPDAATALKLLGDKMFDAVFCDESIEEIGGVPFVVAARREKGVLDKMIPIFLICSAARLRQVKRARDVGVSDVLARPISAATIMRKLSAALLKPRPFIAAPGFFGPDRRAQTRPAYLGEDRRSRKTRKVKVAKPAADTTPALDGTEVYL